MYILNIKEITPYSIDVRTSKALSVILSKISHLFTSHINVNKWKWILFSPVKICHKTVFPFTARACMFNLLIYINIQLLYCNTFLWIHNCILFMCKIVFNQNILGMFNQMNTSVSTSGTRTAYPFWSPWVLLRFLVVFVLLGL